MHEQMVAPRRLPRGDAREQGEPTGRLLLRASAGLASANARPAHGRSACVNRRVGGPRGVRRSCVRGTHIEG